VADWWLGQARSCASLLFIHPGGNRIMALRHLNHLTSLFALRAEIIFSLDQFTAHPLTQAHASTFQGLRNDWNVTFAEELALRDGLSAANARVVSIDLTLNTLASRASKALLTVTGDDRTHPLYIAYFKKKSLSEFRRPILGTQLDSMRGWIQPLKTSDVPALAQLGAEVEAAVASADEVLAARAALETESSFFREAGNRKKFFDKVNAARKSIYGELATMPHENMGLPTGFADQFFRHDTAKDEADEPTVESVDAEIADLEQQLVEKKELRAKLQAEAEQAAKEEADEAAKQAVIAELQKVVAEGEQQAAEARAKLAELVG
jgi:hypothetical protein